MAQYQNPYVPYKYAAIVRADEALEERKNVHRTLFAPLYDERDQCKFALARLKEEKEYVMPRLCNKLLTISSITYARNWQILQYISHDWQFARPDERKADLAEAIRKQRDLLDEADRDLGEQVQAKYNRLFEIDHQLRWLEHDYPKSVDDLETERAFLELQYFPPEPVEPVVESAKKSKKKKKGKKA